MKKTQSHDPRRFRHYSQKKLLADLGVSKERRSYAPILIEDELSPIPFTEPDAIGSKSSLEAIYKDMFVEQAKELIQRDAPEANGAEQPEEQSCSDDMSEVGYGVPALELATEYEVAFNNLDTSLLDKHQVSDAVRAA